MSTVGTLQTVVRVRASTSLTENRFLSDSEGRRTESTRVSDHKARAVGPSNHTVEPQAMHKLFERGHFALP